jgi:hypothetical protein
VAAVFIYRSFYGMRIVETKDDNNAVERETHVPAVVGK